MPSIHSLKEYKSPGTPGKSMLQQTDQSYYAPHRIPRIPPTRSSCARQRLCPRPLEGAHTVHEQMDLFSSFIRTEQMDQIHPNTFLIELEKTPGAFFIDS